MENSKVIIRFLIALVALGVLVAGAYFIGTKKNAPTAPDVTQEKPTSNQKAEITSFLVSGKNFVVKGKYLSKVEIFAIPSGTGITPDLYNKFLTAKTYTGSMSSQTFTLSIPCGDNMGTGTHIFAKGYDQEGRELPVINSSSDSGAYLPYGGLFLPYLGVSDVYENVYKPACEVSQQSTASCSFISPKAGDILKFGSTYTVSLKNPPMYEGHCSNGFDLRNADTGEYAGNLDLGQAAQSFQWMVTEETIHQRCGTSGDQAWEPLAPGRYKIVFTENQTQVAGNYPTNTCESGVFTITN